MRQLLSFLCDESGATAVEYAVMLAVILLVLIVGVMEFGNAQNGSWAKIDSELSNVGF
uniref:Flp family type IVb pilin n=1 Tax=Schlesneria paludicola TaxID=360056 RepID=A0A7C2PBC5_9PLAN